MNLRKIYIGLLVALASVCCVTSASATTFTSSAGTMEWAESTFTGSVATESEGHVILDNPLATASCASNLEGKVESHGEGVTGKIGLSVLSFSSCENSWHITTVTPGTLEVHATELGNGTVTSSGATVEATRLGVTCRYATSATSVGTLTGSTFNGDNATLDLEAKIPFHSGSAFCGTSPISWTGSYKFTTPSLLSLQDPGGKPNVEISGSKTGDFSESEERTIFITDKTGKVNWKLEEAYLSVFSGTWSVSEADKCKGIGVTGGQGAVCQMKVKCEKKGDARYEVKVSTGGTKFRFFIAPMKCA